MNVRENNIEKLNLALHEYQTLNRLLMELADLNYGFLLWLRDYCEAEKIPLWKKPQFTNLLETSERLFKKLDKPLMRLKLLFPSDKNLQRRKSDKDFTEPLINNLKYLSTFAHTEFKGIKNA